MTPSLKVADAPLPAAVPQQPHADAVIGAEPAIADMTPARRLASVGAASAAPLVAGLVTSRLTAGSVGLPGVGHYAVLMGHAANATLDADLNVTNALTREIGRAGTRADAGGRDGIEGVRGHGPGALLAASVLITSIASMSMMLLTALAAPVVARALLPSAFASSALVTVAAAGCLTMASIQILSAVAALDRLRIYRRALLMQAVAGPCVAAISLRSRGVGALPGMILRMSIASVLIACVSLWVVRDAIERPCRGAVRAAAAMLARQGGLFTLAAVVGNGVVNVTPLLVARMAGHDAAGLYRAASVLSAGYLTVLTTALGREFLPRASRDGLDPPTLHRTLDAQVRLMSAVALPVVLTGFVAAPIAIRAVFGSEFGDAWHILAAQLPGDVLRIIGFTLVYGLIASTGARMVVVSEVVGGLALLGCVVAIVPTSGSVGIGVALTSAYAIYVPLAFLLLNRATGYRPSAQARNAVLGATAVAAAPALLLATMGPTAAEVVAGCLAVAAATALISTYSTNVPAPLRRLAGAAATEHTTGTRSRP